MRKSRFSEEQIIGVIMLRPGVSLPALRQLSHKDIRMTLRYVQVTQQDLQREFHQARQKAAQPHRVPALSFPKGIHTADLPGFRRALMATGTSWRCIAVSSAMRKPSAGCSA